MHQVTKSTRRWINYQNKGSEDSISENFTRVKSDDSDLLKQTNISHTMNNKQIGTGTQQQPRAPIFLLPYYELLTQRVCL